MESTATESSKPTQSVQPSSSEHSPWRNPIWFGVALVVILVLVAGYYFLWPSQDLNAGIVLTTDPSVVLAGEPFTLSASLSNESAATLKNASLAIVLPDNVISLDSPSERVVTTSIGDIDAGGSSHETFNFIATGGANTVQSFSARLVYSSPDSSAQFESDGSLDVPVGQSAVSMNISAPSQVFSGENFPMTVSYNNNTGNAITGLSLAMQYPPAFSFARASSSLTALAANGTNSTAGGANDSWSLGTIPPNAGGAITITGNIVGGANVSYPIVANLTDVIAGQSYTIANPTANVVLASSPLSFSIAANGATNAIATPGENLSYTLSFTNDSSVAFQDIVITANLTGAMFNFPSLETNGTFNSVADTLTWSGAEVPQLLSLAPGQSGSVDFKVHAASAFPIRLPSDKNYSIGVSAKLFSPTVPPGTAASSTISVANMTTKFSGAISLDETAYWKDPTALAAAAPAIKNTGPYPPRVNQATQYSIHWLITNYATDADNVTISANLQAGTTCTGVIKAPASTTLACNPSNGQVTWTIPEVAATTGITNKPLEAVFQVANTPSVNEVGQYLTLVGPATLSATDAFTGVQLQSTAQPITTTLPDDTSVSPGTSRLVGQ